MQGKARIGIVRNGPRGRAEHDCQVGCSCRGRGMVAMPDMHTLRVALVDDEQDQLDLLTSYVCRFARDEGFNVALSAFRNGFDLMAEGGTDPGGAF